MASLCVRAIAALLFAAILPFEALSAPLVTSFDQLPELSSQPVILLPPASSSGGAVYRFVSPEASGQEEAWLGFVEPLELSAALGEERTYVLEVRDAGADARTKKLTIDRKSPGLPRPSSAPGLYRSDLRLELEARDGSEIWYSLSAASQPGVDAFKPFVPADGIGLGIPSKGAETWLLRAYAVDKAGNVGPLLSASYRLAADDLDYAEPPSIADGVLESSPLAGLSEPLESRFDTGLRLIFSPPAGEDLLVAINPPGDSPTREDFVRPSGPDGRSLDLSWPLGWTGKARIFLGLEKDGSLAYRPSPVELSLGGFSELLPPAKPSLAPGGEGRAPVVSFPDYDGSILLSVNGGDYAIQKTPLALAGLSGEARLSWYGIDALGRTSPVQDLTLDLSPGREKTLLVGLPEEAVASSPLTLSSTGPDSLHYEISTDPAAPPKEPRASSPVLGSGLRLDPPAGSTTTYIIRHRGFDAAGNPVDEGGTASFTIDREAPPPPSLAVPVPAYSSKAITLSWLPSEAVLMVAVDVDAKTGAFTPLSGPLRLEGSASGPVEYRIHAYAQDAAGNRSPESPVQNVLVDLATVYIAEGGPQAGDGSRDAPFPNLDSALASLSSAGSSPSLRILHLRGTLTLSSAQTLKGLNLRMEGGYSADWKRTPGLSSAIHVGDEGGPAPMIALQSSHLDLASVSIRAPRLEGPLFSLQDSELRIVASSILASSASDLLLIDARESRLELSSCEVLLGEGSSVSFLAARNTWVGIETSTLTGSGATYYSALSLDGGSLSLKHSGLSSSALLGTRLMELKKTNIEIDGALFDIQGGGGFLSFGSFEACTGRLVNSHLLLSWEGSGSLFRIKGGKLSFLHDSFYGVTKKGSLRFFDAEGQSLVLKNSILDAKGEANILVSSSSLPSPGDIQANCLWGFKTLVSGPRSLIDPIALNEYNGRGPAQGVLPNFFEDPFLTFGPDPPSTFSLQSTSRCIDAGLALPDLGLDYASLPRPSGLVPDIGADEVQR